MPTVTRFRRLKNKYQSSALISTDYEILSNNKVTGWSVNFPIVETCKPSRVCAETCYGLTGPITWNNSLNKQSRNFEWVKEDPKGFALKLEKEARRKLKKDGDFFIRWNGVGDLFEESVESLIALNELIPELPIWCVTRIPEQVLPLKNLANVWVHFSLDGDTLDRREAVLKLTQGDMTNLFFSYQTDKDEVLTALPRDISVLFFDRYRVPTNSETFLSHPALCPLNSNDDITNVCNTCRRCFSGEAINLRHS